MTGWTGRLMETDEQQRGWSRAGKVLDRPGWGGGGGFPCPPRTLLLKTRATAAPHAAGLTLSSPALGFSGPWLSTRPPSPLGLSLGRFPSDHPPQGPAARGLTLPCISLLSAPAPVRRLPASAIPRSAAPGGRGAAGFFPGCLQHRARPTAHGTRHRQEPGSSPGTFWPLHTLPLSSMASSLSSVHTGHLFPAFQGINLDLGKNKPTQTKLP